MKENEDFEELAYRLTCRLEDLSYKLYGRLARADSTKQFENDMAEILELSAKVLPQTAAMRLRLDQS